METTWAPPQPGCGLGEAAVRGLEVVAAKAGRGTSCGPVLGHQLVHHSAPRARAWEGSRGAERANEDTRCDR